MTDKTEFTNELVSKSGPVGLSLSVPLGLTQPSHYLLGLLSKVGHP